MKRAVNNECRHPTSSDRDNAVQRASQTYRVPISADRERGVGLTGGDYTISARPRFACATRPRACSTQRVRVMLLIFNIYRELLPLSLYCHLFHRCGRVCSWSAGSTENAQSTPRVRLILSCFPRTDDVVMIEGYHRAAVALSFWR